MAKTNRGLSEAERAERRARDRERLQHRRGTATLLLAHPGIGPKPPLRRVQMARRAATW
jgi:hypothetical protein